MAGRTSTLARTLWCLLGGIGVFVAISVIMVVALRWLHPPTTAFMLAAKQDAGLRYEWVNLDRISPNLPLAVIASEDQKFPEHGGFDVQAIEKAYAMNQHRHQIHGASTISQQVAKNLFLWSGRSYVRKGMEVYFTVLIEACWPKRRILEVYLNVAQFGPGTFGAEAASQRFFHESAARLNRSDAATLAAVLPSPERFSAAAPSAYVQGRRTWILGQMQALGGSEMLDEIDAYPGRQP